MPKPVDHDEIRDWLRKGKSVPIVAQKVGCHPDTVRRVKRRMDDDGDDDGDDERRPAQSDPGEPVDESVREVRAQWQKERYKSRLLQARAETIEAERRIRRAEQEDHRPPPTDWAAVLREVLPQLRPEQRQDETGKLLIDIMQRQLDAQERRLEAQQAQLRAAIEALHDRPEEPSAAPRKGNALGDAVSQIQALAELLDLTERFRREREGDGGGFLERMAERMLASRFGGEPAPPAPASGPASAAGNNGALPHKAQEDPMANVQREKRNRVELFVSAVAQECLLGSDPEIVAGSENGAELVGMLPAEIRAPLIAGDWPRAWQACKAVDPAIGERFDRHLEAEPVKRWLEAYAKALADPGDDTEGEPA